MTGPKLARQVFGSGRIYRHPVTGEEAPSITTVISALDKPALPRWAAREAAQYAVEQWAVLANLPARERTDLIKAAPWRSSGDAADLGTAVHDAVDRLNTGRSALNGNADATAPFLRQFADFTATWKPEFLHSEFTVWNRTHRYAGTGDFIARIGDRVFLADTKTGKGVWPEVALQLAALAHGECMVTPDGNERPLPDIDALAVLHLRPNGWEFIQVHDDEANWRAFLAARSLTAWKTRSHAVFGTRVSGSAAPDTVPEPA